MSSGGRLVLAVLVGIAAVLVAPGVAVAHPQADLATVELHTVPPMPETLFRFDGVELIADAAGVARLAVPVGSQQHVLEVLPPTFQPTGRIVEFVRWWGRGLRDEGFSPSISDLRVRRNMKIHVGFRISHEVTFAFVDQASDPLDRARVSAVTLRNDAGQVETVTGQADILLTGVRPILERDVLVARSATYVVEGIEVDGSNAVTAGDQRFAPGQAQDVTLTVPLQDVRLRSSDLLFGHPVGRSVELTYPDGRSTSVSLDRDGEAVVTGLVRGSYALHADAPGYAPVQELELSRSQTINLRVLSVADMATMVGSTVLVVGGLFLTRRYRRRIPEPECAS